MVFGTQRTALIVAFLKKHMAIIISVFSLSISILGYVQSVRGIRISQRAYVFHEAQLTNAAELAEAIKNKSPELPVYIKFVTKNLGNTPALNMVHDFYWNIPGHSCVNVKGDRLPLSAADLGPKDTATENLWFTYFKCKHLENTGSFPNPFSTGVTGRVIYKDVFGKSHSITICYVVLASDEGALLSQCDQQEQDSKSPVPKLPSVPLRLGEWLVDEKGNLTPHHDK